MSLRSFLLPAEDILRLREAGGPLAELPDHLLERVNAGHASVAVVEVEGQIVAYWVVFYALHAEPLWVKESHRKHPGVLRSLIAETTALIQATEEPVAFAIVGQPDLDLHQVDPRRLRFAPVPGDLYYLVVPGPETPTPETEA